MRSLTTLIEVIFGMIETQAIAIDFSIYYRDRNNLIPFIARFYS